MSTARSDVTEPSTLLTPPPSRVLSSEKRVRARLGDVTIAESYSPTLLVQYGRPPKLPTYYFEPGEVRSESLFNSRTRADGSTTWDVRANGRTAPNGAWTFANPTGELSGLREKITFDWFGTIEWLEEDGRVFAHARDPYKRLDVLESSRHVQVSVGGVTLADSSRPHLVFETMMPVRYYLPSDDVRLDLLTRSETVTMCAYKGVSEHWKYGLGEEAPIDVARSYPDPVPENPRIGDLICFYNERVDLTVDGHHLARPQTPWSAS